MYETSATLLLRLQADGDEREVAWSTFCQQYEPMIAGFARRLGLPPSDIPDLVQHVVLGFYSAQPLFVYNPSQGRFRSYLKTCVLHEIQRLRTTHATRSQRERSVAKPEQSPDPNLNIDELWDKQWESTQLDLALERVKSHYANSKTFEAFQRTVLLNQDPTQVATDLGLSRDSVYQAKTRVLARLKLETQHLAQLMGD